MKRFDANHRFSYTEEKQVPILLSSSRMTQMTCLQTQLKLCVTDGGNTTKRNGAASKLGSHVVSSLDSQLIICSTDNH